MNRYDLDQIRSKLFSRDGGASLTDEGIPFLIQQMKKDSLIKSNKTQRLRADRYNERVQKAQPKIQPSKNYILDKMKANERIFEREKTKHMQKYDYVDVLDKAKKLWLSQQP